MNATPPALNTTPGWTPPALAPSNDSFGFVLNNLLQCANSQLVADNRATCSVFVAPGLDVAWDNCCGDCNNTPGTLGGQLWSRLIDVVPADDVFNPTCGYPLLRARIGIGTTRCVHTLGDDATIPTDGEKDGDSAQITKDAAAILKAYSCCMRTSPGITQARVERYTSLGPEGGCAGGEWIFRMVMDVCAGC